MKQHQYYNKSLKTHARRLRSDMTKAQACLWKYSLRAGQMRGFKFKRERPVLNFIADFMCQELQLIIEVDGLTHIWEETIQKDKKKDLELQNAGFRVVRFTDTEVLQQMNEVYAVISDTIDLILQDRAIANNLSEQSSLGDLPLTPSKGGNVALSPSGDDKRS
jgi:very-short-patch-repair endonuclease